MLKDVTNLEGNSLLSVKKWDLADRYLVYIIKGKNEFKINDEIHESGMCAEHILDEEWLRLKNLWVSQSTQENDYSAWKASVFFPKEKTYTKEYVEWYQSRNLKPLPKLDFDDVREAALSYALDCYGGFVTAKVRFVAKDLISNYCLFNKIKMLPVHI